MRAAGVLVLFATVASAEPYAVGGTLRPFSLADQHGARASVGEEVRLLLLSRDMGAGDIVKGALGDADQRFLDERRAVYLADVSGMPAMIRRMFALPKMRKRPYRVLIDEDGTVARDFPRVEGKPTLVLLDRLRITRIDHPASASELGRALESAPR